MKNNLQIIDSLLVMQARQLADEEGKRALLGLRNRVYALGTRPSSTDGIHQPQDLRRRAFLQELSANIVESAATPAIELTVRAIPLDVGLDFAIPLGLLVTELVTNSLKHAFPDGKGTIEVLLDSNEDGTVVLVVSDDGQGYGRSKAPSRPKTALGTTIIEGLVAQLKGTITMHGKNGTRSEVRLAAPAPA